MDEVEKIKLRYKNRNNNPSIVKNSNSIYSAFVCNEREKHYHQIIDKYFENVEKIKLLEIGAGEGLNINFFKSLGLNPKNISANELLTERVEKLKTNHQNITILQGNALKLNEDLKFDIVFQSTVFTSILDTDFRQQLADKMLALTKKEGIILWYDFIYNNPKNKDVKKVSKKEIRHLFKAAKKITFKPATVAPPIGRKIGRLYNLFNLFFPFLRTHLIAIIEK